MAKKIYYCVCEDWSENVAVASFGGDNMKQERVYATSCFKTCHGIYNTPIKAKMKAQEVRNSIARNRAAQAPQVAAALYPEEGRIVHQPVANPPIDVIDPEQTMTAEEIRAAIKAGMDAERNAQK